VVGVKERFAAPVQQHQSQDCGDDTGTSQHDEAWHHPRIQVKNVVAIHVVSQEGNLRNVLLEQRIHSSQTNLAQDELGVWLDLEDARQDAHDEHVKARDGVNDLGEDKTLPVLLDRHWQDPKHQNGHEEEQHGDAAEHEEEELDPVDTESVGVDGMWRQRKGQ